MAPDPQILPFTIDTPTPRRSETRDVYYYPSDVGRLKTGFHVDRMVVRSASTSEFWKLQLFDRAAAMNESFVQIADSTMSSARWAQRIRDELQGIDAVVGVRVHMRDGAPHAFVIVSDATDDVGFAIVEAVVTYRRRLDLDLDFDIVPLASAALVPEDARSA
jgi:hypothetical protein